MSDTHTGNVQPQIDNEEHEHRVSPATKRVIPYGYDGSVKNVFFVDTNGTQRSLATVTIGSVATITMGSSATVTLTSIPTVSVQMLPFSYYQQASLASGFVFHGFTAPGGNPTTMTFKLLRETLRTGEVLFGEGLSTFTFGWSGASLGSINWS